MKRAALGSLALCVAVGCADPDVAGRGGQELKGRQLYPPAPTVRPTQARTRSGGLAANVRPASLDRRDGVRRDLLVDATRPGFSGARLVPLRSCEEVEESLRTQALAEMNRRIDESLEWALRSASYYGGCYYLDDADGPAPSPGNTGAGADPGRTEGPTNVSGTNNQVANVDEADFVKADGQYLYVASGGSFRILRSWPAPETREIASVPLEGNPRKLFVYGDRALVYSSIAPGSGGRVRVSRECTYGYSCSFTGDGNDTRISVFDISDRAKPELVREIDVSASYVNARRIDAGVHIVLSAAAPRLTGLRYYPTNLYYDCWSSPSEEEIRNAFEALRAENTRIILNADFGSWLPSMTDTQSKGRFSPSVRPLFDCREFYRSVVDGGQQLTILVSLNMTRETPAAVASIVSKPGAVYASQGALYMAVPHDRRSGEAWFSEMYDYSQASTIHMFRLQSEPTRATYTASGFVKGRVLNQFSMDEHDGYLRVATTTGRVPSPDVHSTLTVLRKRGHSLLPVGTLDRLAPKEDIRSVRFSGDRGYIVTFKKTDPLFVLDLAQPAAPNVRAELKIPGFSTYMHMMDDHHLLTIGYDAEDHGSFAYFTGVLLQIFDVTDPANPVLTHRHVIGTRGSSSEALTNHLAFTYFAPRKVLALPMTICEGSAGGGRYGTDMTFSGLMVFSVTPEEGFSLRGKVPHPPGQDATCRNWWTRASSQVKRSIIADDFVYSLSGSLVKVNHLDQLGVDLATVSIGQ